VADAGALPPNESGKCSRCGATEASGWYGKLPDKYCKKHYDADNTSKRKAAGQGEGSTSVGSTSVGPPHAPSPAAIMLGADATIEEIFAIVDERFPAPHTPSPQP